MSSTPNSPKGLEHLETVRRKRYALEQRLVKRSFRAIADELGISIETCRMWIKEMTQTMLPQEEIEELRAQEADALDASEQRILMCMEWIAKEADRRTAHKDEAGNPDPLPIGHQLEQMAGFEDRLANVRRQRAKLLGVDVPVRVAHTLTVRTEFDAEVEELVSQLLGGGKLLSTPDQVDTGTEAEQGANA